MSLISINWQDKYPRLISEAQIVSITQIESQCKNRQCFEVKLADGSNYNIFDEPSRHIVIEGSGFELWEVNEPEEGVIVTEDCIIRHPLLAVQLTIGIFSGVTENMLPTGLWDYETSESLLQDSPRFSRFMIVSKDSKTIWMLKHRCSLASFSSAIEMILGEGYALSPDFMQDNTNEGLACKVG